MPKRGENIYHRKDGRWEGRFRLPGEKKYRSVYAKSYRECRELRRKRLSESRTAVQRSRSFSEACEKWLAHKKNSVKASTFIKYKTTIERYFLEFFKEENAILTSEELHRFIDRLIEKGLSARSVSEHFKLLKQICTFAEIAEANAFEKAKEYLPKQQKRTVKVMDENDRMKLEAYLLRCTDNRELSIYLAMSLGLRIGEICALLWSDIDLGHKTLRVNKTLQRVAVAEKSSVGQPKSKIIINSTKTGAGMREIPLPDKLVAHLKRFCPGNEDSYITTGQSTFIEPRTLSNFFHKLLKKLDISDVNFHVLRHTFATRYAEKIGNIKALSEILGHANVQITMLFYVHPSVEFKRESIEMLM